MGEHSTEAKHGADVQAWLAETRELLERWNPDALKRDVFVPASPPLLTALRAADQRVRELEA